MKVTNLLDNKTHKVKQYKNMLYYETESTAYPYYVLERSYKDVEDIEEGLLYTYYKSGDELYTGFLTNNYKPFAQEIEQLKLF